MLIDKERIKLPTKLLDYFLRSDKSNINNLRLHLIGTTVATFTRAQVFQERSIRVIHGVAKGLCDFNASNASADWAFLVSF